MNHFLLTDLTAAKPTPGRFRLVFIPKNTGYEVYHATDVRARLAVLRSYMRHPRSHPNKALRTFCLADPAHCRLSDWRVELLEGNEAFTDLAPLDRQLNAPSGRPVRITGLRGRSPLSALRSYHGTIANRVPPALQDCVDRWPADPRPAFSDGAWQPALALHQWFSQSVETAMTHDENYNPSPRAIAGLYLRWAALHGLVDATGMPLAGPASVPLDLFAIFDAPALPGWGAFPYRGQPERRKRGFRRVKN